MQAKFPTIDVFKQAVNIPLMHIGSILASIGIFVGAIVVVSILLTIVMIAMGGGEMFAEMVGSGSFDPNQMVDTIGLGALVLALAPLLLILIFFFLGAHIFNYWVNLAAFGKQHARWSFSDEDFPVPW